MHDFLDGIPVERLKELRSLVEYTKDKTLDTHEFEKAKEWLMMIDHQIEKINHPYSYIQIDNGNFS